jgi:hypothetical protein
MKFIFTAVRRNGLTEMRKCERKKEGICEEEGNRVASWFIGAWLEQRNPIFSASKSVLACY